MNTRPTGEDSPEARNPFFTRYAMDRPRRRIDWKYGLSWIVANAVAWAIGIGLTSGLNNDALGWMGGIGGMLLIGGAQWLVLSRRFPHSPWWLLAYAPPWLVALVVGAHFGFLVPDPVWFGTTGGTVAGLLQWRVLRRYVHRSIAWLPAMIASATVGCMAGVKVGWSVYRGDVSQTAAYTIGAGVAGATLGLLSAIALLYFVAQTASSTPASITASGARPTSTRRSE